jgi:hypothetical protein
VMAPLPAPPDTDVDFFAGAQATRAIVAPRARPPRTSERLLRLTPLSAGGLGLVEERSTRQGYCREIS